MIKAQQEFKTDVLSYKAAQADAQRAGTDVGTYPQWKLAQEKREAHRLALLEATKEDKPKKVRKPRAKKAE